MVTTTALNCWQHLKPARSIHLAPNLLKAKLLLDSAERNIDGRKGKSTSDVFDARFTREIAQTDAGPIGMATGIEFRRENWKITLLTKFWQAQFTPHRNPAASVKHVMSKRSLLSSTFH